MKRCVAAVGLVAVVAAFGATARAAETCDFYSLGHTRAEAFRLATVAGPAGTKVYFHNDQSCGAQRCQGKAYLVPGDRLVVSRVAGGWACGFYIRDRRQTVGWLAAGQLKITPPNRHPPVDAWLARWLGNRGSINIDRGKRPGAIHIDALTVGPGGNPAAPNTGDIEGSAMPAGNQVHLTAPYGCRFRLVLVGDLLVASDNESCGGMGVTFDGVHRKAPTD